MFPRRSTVSPRCGLLRAAGSDSKLQAQPLKYCAVPVTAVAADNGSVTAEFAMVIPAVLILVVLLLGGFRASVEQIALADRASDTARLLGRGADQSWQLQPEGVSFRRTDSAPFVCITASSVVVLWPLHIPITARGCALDEEQLQR